MTGVQNRNDVIAIRHSEWHKKCFGWRGRIAVAKGDGLHTKLPGFQEYVTKASGGIRGVYIDALQNLELDGHSVIISMPPSSPPSRRGREVWIHVTGSWLPPRAGLHVESKTEIRPCQDQAVMSSKLTSHQSASLPLQPFGTVRPL